MHLRVLIWPPRVEEIFKMLPLKNQKAVYVKLHVFYFIGTIKSGKRILTRLVSPKYVFHLKNGITIENCHSFNKHLMSVNYEPGSRLS